MGYENSMGPLSWWRALKIGTRILFWMQEGLLNNGLNIHSILHGKCTCSIKCEVALTAFHVFPF